MCSVDPLRPHDGSDDTNSKPVLALLPYCRACGFADAGRHGQHDLFASDGGRLAVLYVGCTGLACAAGDGLPPSLCGVCHAKLSDFHAFRLRCAQWDDTFRQQRQPQKQQTPTPTKTTTAATKREPSVEYCMLEIQPQVCMQIIKDEPQLDEPTVDYLNYDDLDDDDDGDAGDADKDAADPATPRITPPATNPINRPPPPTDGRLQCDICHSYQTNRKAMVKHMHEKHVADTRCTWPACGRRFASLQSMRNHLHAMHERPARLAAGEAVPEPRRRLYVCEQCGKQFKQSGALSKHRYTHGPPSALPFGCTVCAKRYVTKHKLGEHMMRHAGVKNHECPHCGLRKTTLSELRIHLNYHTKERQWQCNYCAKTFNNIGNWTRHVRIVHEGVRAFKCTHCELTFGKAETLKHHVMTHTGEKPWECGECGKRFIQPTALQTHQKTHKRKAPAAAAAPSEVGDAAAAAGGT